MSGWVFPVSQEDTACRVTSVSYTHLPLSINVTKYKLLAFVTSASLAGAAGALFGLNYSNVTAVQFDFNTSILVLVYVVLGGLGNIWGSIVATVVLYVLPEALRQFSDYRMLVYAIVLIPVSYTQDVYKRQPYRRMG